MVSFQQHLFKLPDLNQMQVKVRVHESKVKKIKVGQKAEIRVDAYPNQVLHGTVKTVATLADSEGIWSRGNVKEYETMVDIADLPAEAGLKPGMTAEVSIKVNHLSDVLLVPVQAVTERQGQHFVYAQEPQGVVRREVTVGETNEQFVEIKEGLEEDERVCLDARARSCAGIQGRAPRDSRARSSSGSRCPASGELRVCSRSPASPRSRASLAGGELRVFSRSPASPRSRASLAGGN